MDCWTIREKNYSYIILSILVILLIWYLILNYCRSKKNAVTNNMPPPYTVSSSCSQ
ncbi:DP93R [African swine fever virus]|nr:DP93R [African swine fever virus]